MAQLIIRNGLIFNRGEAREADILIAKGRIQKIDTHIDANADREINAAGKWVIPGIIDDQVHFREPGLTHKADIYSESMAAVAGGVTSFMEMPNTLPPATTQKLLQDKYDIAVKNAWCNYSFFMGITNDNLNEVFRTDPERVCGVKAFMGSSTGNMLVDKISTLERLFKECKLLIATHCEDEATIRKNSISVLEKYNGHLTAAQHPEIRNEEACYLSSSLAVSLAKQYGSRLHVLHISTEKELSLFDHHSALIDKRITAEVCVHHLYFTSAQYKELGNLIKCNPAIKDPHHSKALMAGLLDNHLDIIATDHAPHTWEEKQRAYLEAPAGLPLVQHGINIMMDLMWQGKITMEKIVEKMCHAPAQCFKIRDRGYIDEGYAADIAIIDPSRDWVLNKTDILYKCGWSPLEGKRFKGAVSHTVVNGHIVYQNGEFIVPGKGDRLLFASSI